MDKKTKTKWLKALRGGKFRQGDGSLKDARGNYCCLGVLAELKGVDWKGSIPHKDGAPVSEGARAFYLNPSFCGLTRATQLQLAHMNDGADVWIHKGRQSFRQIADHIEKTVRAR